MRQPNIMVKHTQTTRREQPTNCLSVSDYFIALVIKSLSNQLLMSFSNHHNHK